MAQREKPTPRENVIKGRPQDEPSFRGKRVYRLDLRIPAGRVMSCGRVARVLGAGYDARARSGIMRDA